MSGMGYILRLILASSGFAVLAAATFAVPSTASEEGGVLFQGPVSAASLPTGRFRAFDEALAGECEKAMQRIRNWDMDEFPHFKYFQLGELKDRGLCIPFDPVGAFEAFETGQRVMNSPYSLRVAWKLWHGHGVKRDEARARLHFRTAMLRFVPFGPKAVAKITTSHLAGRAPPPPLVEALAWAQALAARPRERLTPFLVELFEGTAQDWRGERIPADPQRAVAMLSDIEHRAPEASYWLVKLTKEGKPTGLSNRDAMFSLSSALHRCHLPAFLLRAEIALAGALGEKADVEKAYRWAYIADLLGHSGTELRESLASRFSSLERLWIEAFARLDIEYERCSE